MSWIIPNEKLLNGVSILNSIDKQNFQKLVDFTSYNDKEKTEKLSELQNIESFLEGKKLNLAFKTITYILKRLMLFLASPETILNDLTQKLNMKSEIAEIMVKAWTKKTKLILEGVCAEKELIDVQWDLKVTLSSSIEQKPKTPIGILRMQTADYNKLNLEMNTSDLMNLFNIFENVQDELDLFKQNTTN
uniref:CSON013648 protein n=1 Tax=Culicoides sonorensis TaxID=179676 RepID=A0A336K2N0_CULSO